MNNILLASIVLLLIGSVSAGALVNDYLSNQNQDNGSDLNSNSGFGKSGIHSNDKPNTITQNNVLNVNSKITVVNVALINVWYQYIEVINIEAGNINFNELNDESIAVGGHSFAIPNGTMASSGYGKNDGEFISSEIYQTSDGCCFGIMVISNPKGTAEELANELANEKGLSISKSTLKKIDSSGSINVFKFESEGIMHYLYDDGNDIVIIAMNQENDNLFMYLTSSSTDGTIDESNPYYNIDSTDDSNETESQNEEEYGSQDNSYSDNSYSDNSYEDNSYDNSYYEDSDYNEENSNEYY